MTREEIIPLIASAANAQQIDPLLFQAVVSIESNFQFMAMRYEPQWMYFHNPPAHASRLGLTVTTETQLQMYSYGLCQVMGSVLRELGYLDYLPAALAPAVSLDYGARHLKAFLLKYGDATKAVAAYNAGSPIKLYTGQYRNQAYVDRVMNVFQGLKSAMKLI